MDMLMLMFPEPQTQSVLLSSSVADIYVSYILVLLHGLPKVMALVLS